MQDRNEVIPGISMLDHANLYKVDIAQVRRWLKEPPAKLCRDTKREIKTHSKDRSAKALAKMYNTTVTKIYAVTSDKENFELADSYIKNFFEEQVDDKELELLAESLQTTIAHVKRVYRTWLSDKVTELRKDFTIAEVADLIGIHMSKVTRLNQQAMKKGEYTKLEDSEWSRLIKAYMGKESITSLAKRFNISRAAIYGKLNREGIL